MNGRLILEGALRIYWGVRGVIHLKEDDDQRTVVTARHRNSCRRSVADVCIFHFSLIKFNRDFMFLKEKKILFLTFYEYLIFINY